jgi:hypothetical protein
MTSRQKTLKDLYDFFIQHYANSFLNAYGHKPNDAWAYTLKDLTDEEIRLAAMNVVTCGHWKDFAPTPSAFLEHAKRLSKRRKEREEWDRIMKLPHKEKTPEERALATRTAEAYIANMRQILG